MSAQFSLVQKTARIWIVIAGLAYAYDLFRPTGSGLTDASGRPLGDDFVNYWSGAFLAWHGRVAEVYNWPAYHAFQQSIVGSGLDPYHYSYPPVLLLLTAPLALLPYLPGLGVWLVSGWLCFYRALISAVPERSVLLLALATPAVFVNAYGGQNGTWTAAFFGGGLCLIDRRPFVAGLLFGLLSYKPHLGLLIPVALLAGRRWWAIAGAATSAGGLVAASTALFGPEIWRDYLGFADVLRQTILENGTGVWHRMVSVFVFVRRLGADVPLAYALQAVVGSIAAVFVALAWFRDVPPPVRNAALVLGTLLTTPYLQDYDMVVGAFVAVWLMSAESLARISERNALAASSLILMLPLAAAPLAQLTGFALGLLFVIPACLLTARMILAERAAAAPGVRQPAIRRGA
jgi:arabinofuranan 3-O-arabinosyltransferase